MKKSEWAKSFAATRAEVGLSQIQAAKACKVARFTVQRWEAGKCCPSPSTRPAFLSALRKTEKGPSHRRRAAVAKSHHIYLDRSKGWVLRCTVSRGPKLVGIRIRETLRTRVLAEAKRRAEVVMTAYRHMGLTIVLRMQKPAQSSPEASGGKRVRKSAPVTAAKTLLLDGSKRGATATR